jgi:hypothetical protein
MWAPALDRNTISKNIISRAIKTRPVPIIKRSKGANAELLAGNEKPNNAVQLACVIVPKITRAILNIINDSASSRHTDRLTTLRLLLNRRNLRRHLSMMVLRSLHQASAQLKTQSQSAGDEVEDRSRQSASAA